MSTSSSDSEKTAHIHFIECLGRIDLAIRQAESVEQLMSEVLKTTLKIFQVDRAWLFYPCDPQAETWHVPMEITVPEFPGALAMNTHIPMNPEVAAICQEALDADDVVNYDYKNTGKSPESAKKYSNKSQLHIVLHPKHGNAWLFGLHQCAYARDWSEADVELFREIARRLSDGLNSLLFLRDLQQSERKFRTLLKASPVAMYETDSKGKLLYVNQRWKQLLGLDIEQANNGGWQNIIAQHDRNRVLSHWQHHREQQKDWEMEYRIFSGELGIRWILEKSRVLHDNGEVCGYLGINIDITEQKKHADRLGYQARHDDLTGLFNRREFEKRTKQAISSVESYQSQHALCFLDLDQFKVINDLCGHPAGDVLLCQLSIRLKNSLRQQDILARIGGDEFGLLLLDCGLEQATAMAEKIIESIKNFVFIWESKPYQISVSVGLVTIHPGFRDLTEILKQADASCYIAKDLGRNRLHVFSENSAELDRHHTEIQWVPRINDALAQDQFELYAQLISASGTELHKHYELLLRMLDKEGQIIGPDQFMHSAERYDLIGNIDRWVVKQALQALHDNPGFVDQIDFVSINLSGRSLGDDRFMDYVQDLINAQPFLAQKVCFEVTETAVISDMDNALHFIKSLKNCGCRFALDDFGCGLSSFGYLKNLPVDYLKIDGLFVKNMTADKIDYAMVKSINEIAQVIGIKTIAEYVESADIQTQLEALGVDYFQGYHIAKPMPLKQIIINQESIQHLA